MISPKKCIWIVSLTAVFWNTGSIAKATAEQASLGLGLKQNVYALASDAETLYAYADDGLYQYDFDRQRFLHRAPPPNMDQSLNAVLFVSETSVYLAFERTLFCWDGSRWLFLNHFASRIQVCWANGESLWVGTSKGLWVSFDQGELWYAVPAFQQHGIRGMGGDDGDIFVATEQGLYAASQGVGQVPVFQRILGSVPLSGDSDHADMEEPEAPGSGSMGLDRLAQIWVTPGGIVRCRDRDSAWSVLPHVSLRRNQYLMDIRREGEFVFIFLEHAYFVHQLGSDIWGRDVLPGGRIHAIAKDPHMPVLWVASDQGVSRQLISELGVVARGSDTISAAKIAALQRATIAYAEVSQEKISRWRRQARQKAWLPRLSVGFDVDRNANIVSSSSQGVTHFTIGPEKQNFNWNVDLIWDLSDWAFPSEETSIDVRSRLMVQLRRDLLEELTRIYFERERLLAEIQSENLLSAAYQEKSLRIQELAAYLDALSGGALSKLEAGEG